MKLIFSVLAAAIMFISKAQVIQQPFVVHYSSLSAYSKNFADVFSASSNQASLATLQSAAVAVYSERRFMLADINSYTAIVAVPTASGSFGMQADYFGLTSFNQTRLSAIYARKVSSKVDVGVKFNYHTIKIAGYGSASTVNFEGGAIYHISDKACVGGHIYNPTSSSIGKTTLERLAFRYVAGVGYEVSEQLFIAAEIVKCQNEAFGVNAGLQYNVTANISIRIGTSPIDNNTYAGAGINLNFCRVDVTTAYNTRLGFTPALLLLFNLKKEVKE